MSGKGCVASQGLLAWEWMAAAWQEAWQEGWQLSGKALRPTLGTAAPNGFELF